MQPTPRRINGPAVRAIRSARGIRVTDLALTLGMSDGALCNVEAGRKTMRADLFPTLAEALSTDGLTVPVEAFTYPVPVQEAA